jgi:hypothetical protein
MRHAAHARYGNRLNGLIVVLWRAGSRMNEALSLIETDLEEQRGSILVRHEKNDRRRQVGMDALWLFVAALQAVVGLPGTALAAVAFIFVGNAISGGSVPIGFLPGGFRQIAPWLPNCAIIRSARDVVYFHGHDLGHPLLVLGLWPMVALILIATVDLIHLSERRNRPHHAHEIYGTPALVHLSRQLRSRQLGTDRVPAALHPHGGRPS